MKRTLFYSILLVLIALLVGVNMYLMRQQDTQEQRIEGLKTQIGYHSEENQALSDRNEALLVDIESLRSPDAYHAYEEKAREDYGMIGQNETYFVLPDSELASLPDVPGLAPDPVVVVNPDESSLRLESIEEPTGAAVQAETIPVTPLPLQLESLQE
ncbi:septum formation initiator family protein [Suttonella sp. R2A3]|uniref:FtsB family cell division protein n=1 Tax=Suttonella sp. R2A3 TaxID=2908648 RepID=UPI001F39104C|nr:septum formation initiator family protein [Suttonella sp. R2A3]UJF25289.1 septum formation initiator family protein [Suttonella sp. R2A3]